MASILLESYVPQDKYVHYVAEKYDLQERERNIIHIPTFDIEELSGFKWNIGLILGNSGSGKSTILKSLGEPKNAVYDDSKAIVSQFPNLSEEEVCELFSSVGLNSIPTYLHTPNHLSNGEKARLDLCYSIANSNDDEWILIDEFTSVVNRMCAKSMSFALQRYIRRMDKKVILASCHYDIVEWLRPDWVFNLNKQNNDEVDIERLIYQDDEEYEVYKKMNENNILGSKEINLG